MANEGKFAVSLCELADGRSLHPPQYTVSCRCLSEMTTAIWCIVCSARHTCTSLRS